MTLRLPTPPQQYSQSDQAQLRRALENYTQTIDSTIAGIGGSPIVLLASLPASAVLSGAVSTVQIGASLTLPGTAIGAVGGVRVRGFWQGINGQNSNMPQPLFGVRFGGQSILQYTTGQMPVGSLPRGFSLDWYFCGASGSSLQAHTLTFLDGGNVGRWDTLPVDLFAQAPAIRAGVARSALDATQNQLIELFVQAPASQAATLTFQFLGGTVELLVG